MSDSGDPEQDAQRELDREREFHGMTDPYTPTTEEVREMMLNEYGDDFADSFDRWLAAHDATVRAEALEAAAVYAEQWAEANEEGGYTRAAYSVAHAIRCGGVALPPLSPQPDTTSVSKPLCCEKCDKAKAEGFRAERPSAVPEPTGDERQVCPICGHHDIAGSDNALSHEDWVQFVMWHAEKNAARLTPTESEKETNTDD